MNKKILLILILSITFTGCLKGKTKNQSKVEEEKAYVKAAPVSYGTLSEYIRYTGDIHGEDEAVVYPKITGKLLKNTVVPGEFVKKGSLIALVDRDEVGYTFNKSPIESPLTGIVGRLYLDRGAQVAPSIPIAVIADIGRVKITTNLSQKDIGKVNIGQEVKIMVDAYPKEGFIGTISEISPMLDINTRTCPIKILVDNFGHRLKPGMFAHIEMTINNKANIFYTVQEAILKEGNAEYVFIVKNGKALKKRITTGIRDANKIEILSGIEGKEQIVITGKEKLKNNYPIELVNE